MIRCTIPGLRSSDQLPDSQQSSKMLRSLRLAFLSSLLEHEH